MLTNCHFVRICDFDLGEIAKAPNVKHTFEAGLTEVTRSRMTRKVNENDSKNTININVLEVFVSDVVFGHAAE